MDKVKLLKAVDTLSDLTMSEWKTLKYIVDSCFDSKQQEYATRIMLPSEEAKKIINSQML